MGFPQGLRCLWQSGRRRGRAAGGGTGFCRWERSLSVSGRGVACADAAEVSLAKVCLVLSSSLHKA